MISSSIWCVFDATNQDAQWEMTFVNVKPTRVTPRYYVSSISNNKIIYFFFNIQIQKDFVLVTPRAPSFNQAR